MILHKPISQSLLTRAADGIKWALKRSDSSNPVPVRFAYDHGSCIIVASDGKRDLLFDHEQKPERSSAALFLSHITPELVLELIRGYEIARKANLLTRQDTRSAKARADTGPGAS